MEEAMKAVASGECGVNRAALDYGIMRKRWEEETERRGDEKKGRRESKESTGEGKEGRRAKDPGKTEKHVVLRAQEGNKLVSHPPYLPPYHLKDQLPRRSDLTNPTVTVMTMYAVYASEPTKTMSWKELVLNGFPVRAVGGYTKIVVETVLLMKMVKTSCVHFVLMFLPLNHVCTCIYSTQSCQFFVWIKSIYVYCSCLESRFWLKLIKK